MLMLTKDADKKREQIQLFCMDDMVPQDHLLRIIDKAIDWSFIYELVEEKYSPDQGRPSMDPVTLIKIPFIQYLYGIKSMRQTIKEIEVNVAYRCFLGLDMFDKVPHTFNAIKILNERYFYESDRVHAWTTLVWRIFFFYQLINKRPINRLINDSK